MKNHQSPTHNFIIGILIGIFISGLFLMLNRKSSNLHLPNTVIQFPLEPTVDNQFSKNHQMESKIDINSAPIDTLMTLPGIGETKAAAIINFRERYGSFEQIEELTYIQGIGQNLFDQISNLIYVSSK